MSRRLGSATALNASVVVAALAMLLIYSHIGICQALFLPFEFPAPETIPRKFFAIFVRYTRSGKFMTTRLLARASVLFVLLFTLCGAAFANNSWVGSLLDAVGTPV